MWLLSHARRSWRAGERYLAEGMASAGVRRPVGLQWVHGAGGVRKGLGGHSQSCGLDFE